MQVLVAARESPLSKAQFDELLTLLPHIPFNPLFLKTKGDNDQKTSLRSLDKTDFFTKEIDELVLKGKATVGLHSAKDLPEPIPKGLKIFAITKGVDNRDVLVFRKGESLKGGMRIATSSKQREASVLQLEKNITFVDLRGTIDQRLSLLEKDQADGIVVAEAALIRLKKTHLNRIYLPGRTTKYQGQLAIVGREGDKKTEALFKEIDVDSQSWP